jgi:hypothetical protein
MLAKVKSVQAVAIISILLAQSENRKGDASRAAPASGKFRRGSRE